MDKPDCKIVQDLLPNYIEKLTNEETNLFVQEHLKECADCRNILENMQKEIEVNNKQDKREVKYIKKFNKKFKVLKGILFSILAVAVIFIVIITRKAIILSSIDSKVSNYENNKENIYVKSYITTSEYTISAERFIKGDVDKFIADRKNKDGSEIITIQIDNETKHKLYIENNGKKVLTEYTYDDLNEKPKRGAHMKMPKNVKSFATYTVIPNAVYSATIGEFIINSIFANIKSVEIDGKEYYAISGKYIFNNENTEEMIKYVDKQTGLLMKKVEIVNENGKSVDYVSNYEYKFDCVTDADLAEPDETQYVRQNGIDFRID